MKRIIYTLLFEDGQFIQSRNFRRQKVGDINWLLKNYNFPFISKHLDEIMIINISKHENNHENFSKVVRQIADKCFVPVTVGGKIYSLEDTKSYFSIGADKIFVNSLLSQSQEEITAIKNYFGSQALVAGVNYYNKDGKIYFANSSGTIDNSINIKEYILNLAKIGVGEVVLQGIHRDGTGFGIDTEILSHIPNQLKIPVVLMGGIGNGNHIADVLSDERVDAISTANLLSFIGNAFALARKNVISCGITIPEFNLDIDI